MGYNRIIYENVFQDIDFHMYSNGHGVKSYIVIKPGGNPNDVLFYFEGQDSLEVDTLGDLLLYLEPGGTMQIPQAVAYEIDAGGTTHPLGWLPEWHIPAPGYVEVNTFSYNPSHTLVLRLGSLSYLPSTCMGNMNWSTYFGGSGNQKAVDIENETGSSDFYVLMEALNSAFSPNGPGKRNYLAKTDIHITKFNANRNIMWHTYFGSDNSEYAVDLEYSDINEMVYVLGNWQKVASVTTVDLPFPPTNNGSYIQSQPGDDDDIFIASFDSEGEISWLTFFGGNKLDYAYSLELNDDQDKLYLGGYTQSNTASFGCNIPSNNGFPICYNEAPYLQTTFGGGLSDGFISYFKLSDHSLFYSTYFGGNEHDEITEIRSFGTTDNKIYFCGSSATHKIKSSISSPTSAHSDGSFPLAKQSTGYFQKDVDQSSMNGFIGFLKNEQLNWCTFLGGTGNDELKEMTINEQNELYVLGHTDNSSGFSSCVPSSAGSWLPICNSNGISYQDASASNDIYIAKFNSSRVLKWSTFYGESGTSEFNSLYHKALDIENDEHGNVYVILNSSLDNSSNQQYINTVPFSGAFNEDENLPAGNTFSDPVLLMFDNNNQPKWATYIGGGDYDRAVALEYGNSILRIAGWSHSTNYPICSLAGAYNQPVNTGSGNNTSGGIITEFNIFSDLLSINNVQIDNDRNFEIFPNPAFDVISLSFASDKKSVVYIRIFNSMGQVMHSSERDAGHGLNLVKLNISDLPTGMYYTNLRFVNYANNITVKFIKSK